MKAKPTTAAAEAAEGVVVVHTTHTTDMVTEHATTGHHTEAVVDTTAEDTDHTDAAVVAADARNAATVLVAEHKRIIYK